MSKKFLIFLPFILATVLTFSYAQFNESLHIGNPAHPYTVSTGELDVGIWGWTGKPYKDYSRYMEIEPRAVIWGYYNPVKTVEFTVSNAYPGAKTFCIVWIRNTGTIAAKVSKIEWKVNGETCTCNLSKVCDCKYVKIKYHGGEIPDWLAENVTEFVNELYNESYINETYYNEMIKTIEMRKSSTGCLHEGLVLDAGENDALIFFWTFKDDTPENANFTGSCTIDFTQFNQ